jgi:hypothetical protein
VLSFKAPVINERQEYNWNTKISFGSEGNYHVFQTADWGAITSRGTTWASGQRESLAIDFGEVENSVTLRARIKPYLVPGQLEQQHVNIYVGDTKAGEWLLTSKQFEDVELELPSHLFNSDAQTSITFEFPDAASPALMATSKDIRELAVAFMSIQFDLLNSDADRSKP